VSTDSLSEIANAAASAAADALASLLDCRVGHADARGERLELAVLEDKIFPESGDRLAVFADLVGATRGLAGLAFTNDCARLMIARVVRDADGFGPREQSALREIGNIALSAACGAIASGSGGTVIPSVPRIGDDISEVLLIDEVLPGMHRLPVLVVEFDLECEDGPLGVTFVWVPEH